MKRLAIVDPSAHLAFFAAVVFVSMLIPGIRWWWLLRIQGFGESVCRVTALTWAGYFAALVLPGAASGDLAKTYLILRQSASGRARAFSTVLADRFLGLYSLLCLGSASVLWLAVASGISGSIVTSLAGSTIVLLLVMTGLVASLLFGPARRRALNLLPEAWNAAWNESFTLYQQGAWQLVGCFGLSMVSSALTITAFAMASALLGAPVSWRSAFLAGPPVVLANCVPLTPGGIGIAEAVASEAYAGFGTSRGAEIMVLLRLIGAVLALPGAMIMLRLPQTAESRTRRCVVPPGADP